jgi:hypothetical protein
MLPVRNPQKTYHTLDEIQLRKEELAAQMQQDNQRLSALKSQLFVSRSESTKSEWITSLISNGITAFDTFMLVRKLMKNYSFLFGRKRK